MFESLNKVNYLALIILSFACAEVDELQQGADSQLTQTKESMANASVNLKAQIEGKKTKSGAVEIGETSGRVTLGAQQSHTTLTGSGPPLVAQEGADIIVDSEDTSTVGPNRQLSIREKRMGQNSSGGLNLAQEESYGDGKDWRKKEANIECDDGRKLSRNIYFKSDSCLSSKILKERARLCKEGWIEVAEECRAGCGNKACLESPSPSEIQSLISKCQGAGQRFEANYEIDGDFYPFPRCLETAN